jgi:hypothetical protein
LNIALAAADDFGHLPSLLVSNPGIKVDDGNVGEVNHAHANRHTGTRVNSF